MNDGTGTAVVVTSVEDVRAAIGASQGSRGARVWRVIAGFLLVLGLAALGTSIARRRAAAAIPQYQTSPIKLGDVRVTVTATGTLEAITTVEVGTEVSGRLLSVQVDTNDTVEKGRLLATIDPEQLRAAAAESAAQVASAEASIRQANATLLEAAQAAKRATEQAKLGLVSQRDLEAALASEERARASKASALASATLARATLSQARLRLEKTKIVSPITGIVLSRRVQPGQTLTAGFQTPVLFRIAQDLTQLRLNVDIDEADIGRVKEGQEADFTVDAYPDRTFSSRVVSLGNEPRKAQNVVTYQAVLSVENQERLLRPGMTCTANILADTRRNVLLAPNAALRFIPPAPTGPQAPKVVGSNSETAKRNQRVWTLIDNAPVPIHVRAGATDGNVTEVVGDQIQAGTQLVVDVKGE